MTSLFPNTGLAFNAKQGPDTDNDGLPDAWETGGHGPLDPRVHGCSPRHADIIVVFCRRAGISTALVNATIERMRTFYSSMPGMNPDGTTGIYLIAVMGNTLTAADSSVAYNDSGLISRAFPSNWRDMGHGYLCETPGAGGQTTGNWSGGSCDWKTAVHEIGHQLGLGHTPVGFDTFSPLYGSLMNYDYSGSYNGDPEGIRFSRGQFASLRLRESNLSEQLPLPIADVSFLSQPPYGFNVESRGARSTAIDWNRNGVFGESNVRADISDGSSVHIGAATALSKIAGAPALVSLNDTTMMVIYPEVEGSSSGSSTTAGLSPGAGGRLKYVTNNGLTSSSPQILVPAGVVGEFSAIRARGKLFLAFQNSVGWAIEARAINVAGGMPREALGLDLTRNVVPTLASLPTGDIIVFLFDKVSHEVKYRMVNYSSTSRAITFGPLRVLKSGLASDASAITSQTPIALAFKTDINRLMMVTTATTSDGSTNRLKVTPIGRIGSDELYGQPDRWVGGTGGNEQTKERPSVVCDPSTGLLRIYFKNMTVDPNSQNTIILSRQMADRRSRDGWREREMVDVWNQSRSGPAAATFGDEVMFAFRWFGPSQTDAMHDNTLHLIMKASAIDRSILGDFDDVTHIFTRGLKNSLGR